MDDLTELALVKVPAITDVGIGEVAQLGNAAYSRIKSIAVVDDNPERRSAVARVLEDLKTNTYQPTLYPLSWIGNPQLLLEQGLDVVFVSVDCGWDAALETIEILHRDGSLSAIAYSQAPNDELLIRCMRSGVREFLKFPFAPGAIEEAFNRIASQNQPAPVTKIINGKSFLFLGAKGGSGVTTTACNFAVSLARDSKQSTLLIDLNLPLGDVALNLGIANEFSTLDALNGAGRLDPTFLMDLVVHHSSGLHVLAAPGKFARVPPADESIDKLIEVAMQTFDYVVVDAGCRMDLAGTKAFDLASTIYFVTQVSIPELRNANRFIVGAMPPYLNKLDVVVNRYAPTLLGAGIEVIERALTRPVKWRIPNDFEAVRSMQNTATPFVLTESKIQRAIQIMAKTASGSQQEETPRKKKPGLFGLRSRVEAPADSAA